MVMVTIITGLRFTVRVRLSLNAGSQGFTTPVASFSNSEITLYRTLRMQSGTGIDLIIPLEGAQQNRFLKCVDSTGKAEWATAEDMAGSHTHPASDIVESTSRQFVTASQKDDLEQQVDI